VFTGRCLANDGSHNAITLLFTGRCLVTAGCCDSRILALSEYATIFEIRIKFDGTVVTRDRKGVKTQPVEPSSMYRGTGLRFEREEQFQGLLSCCPCACADCPFTKHHLASVGLTFCALKESNYFAQPCHFVISAFFFFWYMFLPPVGQSRSVCHCACAVCSLCNESSKRTTEVGLLFWRL
jgi:hypothetical protein